MVVAEGPETLTSAESSAHQATLAGQTPLSPLRRTRTGGPGAKRSAGARALLLVLLTVLVAVGLHAHVGSPSWDTGSKYHDAEVVGAVDAVALVLLLALALRSRRDPTGELLAMRLRTALRYLLGIGAAALSVVLVVLLTNIKLPGPQAAPAGKPSLPSRLPKVRPVKLPPAAPSHFPLSEVVYGLLAALLLAAIALVALRLRHYSRQPEDAAEPEAPAEEYGAALQEAIAGGQRALLRLDDARAAIIACYVAMEQSLARAGTARGSAETPDELLAKAASTLLVSAGAARRLTAIFYEARFSSHPMDNRRRDEAETALGELAADLGGTVLLALGGTAEETGT